jgi:cytochrome c
VKIELQAGVVSSQCLRRPHSGGGCRSKNLPLVRRVCLTGNTYFIKERYMKRYMMLLTAFAVFSTMAWAEDGAALYKAKCAACHGANGEGKIGPALAGTKLSKTQVDDLLTKGAEGKKAPHAKGVAGLTPDQASAIATYVGTLKK